MATLDGAAFSGALLTLRPTLQVVLQVVPVPTASTHAMLTLRADGGGKMYVQDRLAENAEEIFERLDKGAHIYFCGLKAMMPSILQTLEGVAKTKGLEWEETLKTWKSLYPSRTLLLVPISGKFKITTSFNLLAAICNACAKGKAVPETGLAESPRPCLVV